MTKCHFNFQNAASFAARDKADGLILPFWKKDKSAVPAFKKLGEIPQVDTAIKVGDFDGHKGEIFFIYPEKEKERRIILLGLGKKESCTTFLLREAFHSLMKECHTKKIQSLNLVLPEIAIKDEKLVKAISETLVLSNYQFTELKHDGLKKHPVNFLESAQFIGISDKLLKIANQAIEVAKGVYLTRDLVNRNADDVTPEKLADTAKALEKVSSKIKVTVFDKKRIEKEEMGLLLAVNRGSNLEPRFIIATYNGDPKSKDHFALVGKGITYDTGGLSLKPTNFMLDMKSDMAGSATVLGTLYAAASLNLKVNLTAVIASSENSIGSKSYKIGDVYQGYSGKTVEITNTDAEGRLALADALSYTVKKLKPTAMINLATLTGAVVVALGDEICGYFANNDKLAEQIEKSAKDTDELIWRLPLQQSYLKMLDSKVADIKNSAGREAGSIQAALFLEQFVEKVPWAHMDIAGTAYWEKSKSYHPYFSTGYGVRMLLDLLENFHNLKKL
ncbi:MAG: leucyl aminopeptidase [Chlamydiota bacterium]|jgi:leucyl aminopeptidase